MKTILKSKINSNSKSILKIISSTSFSSSTTPTPSSSSSSSSFYKRFKSLNFKMVNPIQIVNNHISDKEIKEFSSYQIQNIKGSFLMIKSNPSLLKNIFIFSDTQISIGTPFYLFILSGCVGLFSGNITSTICLLKYGLVINNLNLGLFFGSKINEILDDYEYKRPMNIKSFATTSKYLLYSYLTVNILSNFLVPYPIFLILLWLNYYSSSKILISIKDSFGLEYIFDTNNDNHKKNLIIYKYLQSFGIILFIFHVFILIVASLKWNEYKKMTNFPSAYSELRQLFQVGIDRFKVIAVNDEINENGKINNFRLKSFIKEDDLNI